MTPLQIDTHIPLWGIIAFVIGWLAQAAYQIIKFQFVEKANEKEFKDIHEVLKRKASDNSLQSEHEANRKAFEHMDKKLDHLRSRTAMDLESTRQNIEKEILDIKVDTKEYKAEIRELRDAIMGMSKTVELMALRDMKTRRPQ